MYNGFREKEVIFTKYYIKNKYCIFWSLSDCPSWILNTFPYFFFMCILFEGHFNDVQVFPVMPPQPQMLPPPEIHGVFPIYQNMAPLIPGPTMWKEMNSQWMPFFLPPGCEIEYPHYQSLYRSPFLNPNQWSQIPFQGQGQWKQTTFQTQDKGQLKQTAFSNQGQNQWKQPLTWNVKQNVNMIGQWDRFPVNDKMISQPAISSLISKETGFNVSQCYQY